MSINFCGGFVVFKKDKNQFKCFVANTCIINFIQVTKDK